MNIDPDFVRYSRAGDAFHYRWAARRCLHMVNPTSSIKLIIIEGSRENKLAGEFVIDVAEYYESADLNEKTVAYFQLKHSTQQLDSPFTLSKLQGTIKGFSERYKATSKDGKYPKILNFTIVTNRPISDNCKNNLTKIRNGKVANKIFLRTLKKYTELEDSELAKFCTLINLEDSEGNYIDQRFDLHAELSELQAGVIENPQIDTIIAMVTEKALPGNDGAIVREDVLKRLGIVSVRDLFPAQPKFESIADVIKREQHDVLLDIIIKANAPVIIHAEGGVGKSVVCNQLTESLPAGSKGIIYDCFGAGKYRSRSEPRHRYRDALVQISNELAISGLCKFLVPCNSNSDVSILQAFMDRITAAISSLRKFQVNAILTIFVDAADNAEMAANEFGEICFAHQLLREQFPEGVKLVALCRTERISLLKPQSSVIKKELLPFSYTETLSFLNQHFSNVCKEDGMEFFRLTGGNPRVQANALMIGNKTVSDVLSELSPSPTSVNDLIEAQLKLAVSKLRDALPDIHQKQIDTICLGLANLPPFIPIKVLASAAEVEEAAIKSFVSDLGRPLWVSEYSVQFRDEPTETWFRKQFSATKEQIASFIRNIKSLAATIPYVSEALPALLLQAECYEELVRLSLSDELLPKDSPIDARNIRIYRLQFAFKAALKAKKFADASKLAMRAGEEVSGSNRQIDLLESNVDLIAPLQSSQRVQELAFRRSLRGSWQGSENVYSAALLSSVPEFKGEARSYLKSAKNWLRLHLDERDKLRNKRHEEKLDDDEIIELAYSHYQLFGEKELIRFIMSWSPPEVVLRVASAITRRLVDVSEFDVIDKILQNLLPEEDIVRYQYFCLAVINELWKVFRTPSSNVLRTCLDLLLQKTAQLPEQENRHGEKLRLPEIVSFAEVCSAKNLSKRKIRNLLKLYTEKYASYDVRHEYYHRERYDYLRGVALDAVLAGNMDFEIEVLLPKDWLEKEKKQYDSQELRQFKELIGGMLPWHIVRAKTIVGNISDLTNELKLAHQRSTAASKNRYREYDTLSYEISHIRFEILATYPDPPKPDINQFLELVTSEKIKYRFDDLFQALRCSYRKEHLKPLRDTLESRCYQITSKSNNETPEDRANYYILLSRAVFPENIPDARTYFDYAIEAVSKFGDEMINRWEAVVCIAKRSAVTGENHPEMAYRFIRCAELIGEHVAREKYFDRNEAIKTCAMMSPQIAMSTLSRWRDRDVGWFEEQLPSLIHQCAKMGSLSPATAWSLMAFSSCDGDESLTRWCLENERDPIKRQHMIDTTVHDFLILGSSKKELQALKEIADQVSINNTDLDQALEYYKFLPEKKIQTEIFKNTHTYRDKQDSGVDWNEVLKDLELSSALDISEAIERFNQIEGSRSPEEFWVHVYKKLEENNAYYFLKNLVNAESAERYDMQNALKYFPMKWRSKVSIKELYPQVIQAISRRFATEYADKWTIKYFIESIGEERLIDCMQQGVIEGLRDLSQFINATTFFGFASFSTSYISPEAALDVLDFSLSRFEEHIDDEFGDGPWDNWLIPSENIAEHTTGLIWSALGSPRSGIRWEMAHCVRRLADLSCRDEINALIGWMESGKVGAFGCNAFPFYVLHAKQYLLIALARIAIDNTSLLESHHKIFSKIALGDPPHALIQKFAAEIVLSIEKNYPGTYDSLIVEQVKKIGISPFPVKTLDDKEDMQSTLFHTQNERDNNLEMYFSWDFDKYWFEPLGSIFNISSEQVQKLARHVVIKQWKLIPVDKLINDPRNILWRSRRYERETSHDHGSYPVTDNYNFYISYHAMLTAAAKLLANMPVVQRNNWSDEKWEDWLHIHSLSRRDGRWLSDRRDPPPLEHRNWVTEEKTQNWQWEILSEDFLDGLLRSNDRKTWMNIYGHWNECDSSRNESYIIRSALVSTETAQSLLNALSTCRNPRDYKLPNYMEEQFEIKEFPFDLKGWIYDDHPVKRLDEHDPHAGDINFPPLIIGKEIIEKMGLESDLEKRLWYLRSSPTSVALKCELWGEKEKDEKDGFVRRGQRLSGSLPFLTNMCKQLNKEMIIEVQVTRSIRSSYNINEDDDIKYPPPYSKVYILTGDGVLRDTTTSYKLRETTR